MNDPRFSDNLLDPHAWIQRRVGILEDHLYPPADEDRDRLYLLSRDSRRATPVEAHRRKGNAFEVACVTANCRYCISVTCTQQRGVDAKGIPTAHQNCR